MKNLPKILYVLAFSLILVLFCYFRIKPLYFQTVPYTYDQGRDFLKAHQIVTTLRPALLGPTTGIPGVNHGVWWFYTLTIPFILFQGNPIGFYYFVFAMVLFSAGLFALFLWREFGKTASLLFFGLIAISPYFVKISIFAISSVLAPPALLILFWFFYKYLEQKNLKYLFLMGFALGFLFEAEVAFGLFLVPAFFISVVALRKFKLLFGTWRKFFTFVLGAVIPMFPRIAFELKSGFSQSRLALEYFGRTTGENPKGLYQVYLERMHLFRDFYLQFFPGDSGLLSLVTIFFVLCGAVCAYLYLKKNRRTFYFFILSLLVLLFALSLIYKTTFWQNYFEGLPYFFAVLIALSASALIASKNKILWALVGFYVAYVVTVAGTAVIAEAKKNEPPKLEGLREHLYVADTIYSKVKGEKDVCVMIYTPPIIPHTYDYLFTYLSSRNLPNRGQGFVRKTCYLIIEKDDCTFLDIEVAEKEACAKRPDNWKKINVPKGTTVESTIRINDHVKIEVLKNERL